MFGVIRITPHCCRLLPVEPPQGRRPTQDDKPSPEVKPVLDDDTHMPRGTPLMGATAPLLPYFVSYVRKIFGR